MKLLSTKIQNANHISLVIDLKSFPKASAFYTYLMRLEKKVSLYYIGEKIQKRYLFIPWSDKIRYSFASSSDLVIACTDEINIPQEYIYDNIFSSTSSLFKYFKEKKVKINEKIATAFYAGLLMESDSFRLINNFSHFLADEFVKYGADYKACIRYISHYQSLSTFRLRARMNLGMKMQDSARTCVFNVSHDDISASGANYEDCIEIAKDALSIVNVENIDLFIEKNKIKYNFTKENIVG